MGEEVNQDKNGEADGMNLEVDSKDEVMHHSIGAVSGSRVLYPNFLLDS